MLSNIKAVPFQERQAPPPSSWRSLLFLATSASSLVSHTARQLAIFIEDPGGWRLESGADAVLLLQTVLVAISGLLTTFASIVVVAAIAASVLQNPPRFHLRPHRAGLVPRLDRRWN